MDGPGTAVRVTPDRQRADEWAVVLAAAGIPHWQRHRLDGWALLVPADDAPTALATLAAYDQENAGDRADADALSRPPTIAGAVVALLLIGFFAITGSRAGRSAWFEHGSADAARMVSGEWWRAVTALTLHADTPHVAGNALASVLLITPVCRQLGPGLGLGLLLVAGAGGNALTALAHGGGHVSVGVSTATFGALGILAALRIATPRQLRRRAGVVIAASLALLALLGASPDADLLAHLFGLLVGAGLGLAAALTAPRVAPLIDWLLLAGAAASVALAWRLAF
jgi:membrane associated rhomboid family serine protease